MGFAEKIEYLTGERTSQCYQCGLCSGACPLRFAMDYSPMQIIRMVNLGLEEKIFSSNTIWICSTCFTCQARCPRGIDIPKIMEGLRQMLLRKNVDHVHLKDISKEEIRGLPQIAMVSSQRKFSA
jgi:heterodisulfide reductase subunit C